MPGNHKDEYVYLPIDSKFPLEDYYRLEDAYESGDKEQIESHRRSLMTSIRRFAKDINRSILIHLRRPILVYYFCRRKDFMLRWYDSRPSLTPFVARRIL